MPLSQWSENQELQVDQHIDAVLLHVELDDTYNKLRDIRKHLVKQLDKAHDDNIPSSFVGSLFSWTDLDVSRDNKTRSKAMFHVAINI